MKTRLTIALVLLLSVAELPASEADVERIRLQLQEIATMSSGNIRGPEMIAQYMTYFSNEPTLLPPNMAAIQGRDAIADFYYGAFENITIISNVYVPEAIVVDGDFAIRRYEGTAVFRTSDDDEPRTANNRYVDALVREGGEWKMLWHSWVPVTWEADGAQ